MRFTLRTILLLAAVVLFLVALLSDENYSDLLALGLAAFAGAWLVDELGFGARTFGGSSTGTDNR
jgi:hypothetical protein